MDRDEMEKLELELREYGGGGPSVSRKTAMKAANILRDHRWFVYGEQQQLDSPLRRQFNPGDFTPAKLGDTIAEIEANRNAYPDVSPYLLDAMKEFHQNWVKKLNRDFPDVHRPD